MKNIIMIFALLCSCTQPTNKKTNVNNNKVKSISISTYGGMMGYSQSFKITADSLYFYFNLAVDSTKRRSERKINNGYKLENIIRTAQLNSFSKIADGASNQPVDGTDTKIEIEMSQNVYTVTNGEGNNIWDNTEATLLKIINKEFKDK